MKKIYTLIIILLAFTATVKAQVSEQEFQALKALYNSTNGDQWESRTGWENINTTATKDDVTTAWKGIFGISDGHITNLNFYDNNLTGTLPEEIGNLNQLLFLVFNANHINGPLPLSLKNLTLLHTFAVNGNNLNIPFPTDLIINWPNLNTINIGSCGITGTIPDIFESTPFLRSIRVSENQLNGVLPPSLSNLDLLEFYCDNNQFEGELPPLTNSVSTYRLAFQYNQFSGSIPEKYGRLVLQEFKANDNNLTGTIPEHMFDNPIYAFWIAENYFTFAGIEPSFSKINEATQKSYTTSKKMPLISTAISVNKNEMLTLNATNLSVNNLGGNNNRYKWFKNNVEVYSGNSPIYIISSASTSDAGTYRFEVTNTVVTGMTLKSDNILISVISTNQIPTNISISQTNVDENYYGIFTTLSATDPDAGDIPVFSLTTGNGVNDSDNSKFSISGNLLNLNMPANFELTHTLNILVTVNDGNGGIFTKAFTISVNNVNEAPVYNGQVISKTIDENAANGSVVLNLTAEDPEGSPVTYSITGGNENSAFGVNGNKLVVADSSKFNYDVKNSYSLIVNASDGPLSTDKALTVNLNKINQIPEVQDTTFTIDENSLVGAVVGAIDASDREGDPLVITIIGGNASGAFAISGKNISVVNSAPIDYETSPIFTLTINVSDGISNVHATVTINLNDILELLTGKSILSFSVPGMEGVPVINETAHTIQVLVKDVDLVALAANFTLSEEATSTPISGATLNFITPQTITVTSQAGEIQVWVVTVTLRVGKDEIDKRDIIAYPNPTNSFLNVSGLTKNDEIKLISISGQTILKKVARNEIEIIDIQNLINGSYFLKIESVNNLTIKRIVKL